MKAIYSQAMETNRGMVLLFVLGKLQDELNHPTFVLVGKFKHVAAVSDIKHSVSHTTHVGCR